jgi:cytochrome c-type biogenesis protein CcmH/NrfG
MPKPTTAFTGGFSLFCFLFAIALQAQPEQITVTAPFYLYELDGPARIGSAPPLSPLSRPFSSGGLALSPGTQLQTLKRSRARLRRDGQMAHLDVDSSIEIGLTNRVPFLLLREGRIYIMSRGLERPLLLHTPYASLEITGTEFQIEVTPAGKTEVTVIEGQVQLASILQEGTVAGAIPVETGQIGTVLPGRPPEKRPLIEASENIIQWILYYPGVLDISDLPEELLRDPELESSITAYQRGNLLGAAAALPDRQPRSQAEALFHAAALLAIGQVQEVENLLQQAAPPAQNETLSRIAQALRVLIAAVKFQPAHREEKPMLPTEWLAESWYQQSRAGITGETEAFAPWEATLYEARRTRSGATFQYLENARTAARQAVMLQPDFGFGWARLAELEFSFGRTGEALEALDRAFRIGHTENAQASALRGFLAQAQHQPREALRFFDEAIALDGNLGNAWLGRGLARINQSWQLGPFLLHREQFAQGLEDLRTAAALEPQRSILRSYLGKAFYTASFPNQAHRELERAVQLDPGDPTPWLYSALIHWQENRVNQAIRDLEKSKELNHNRRLFRSRLLLDQDQAVRSANLAAIYRDAGMFDVSVREATRALQYDYANYSAHLFLANSYAALRDPRQINLRYETPWLSQLLLANLLQPGGAGSLSQYVSQQEYSRMFDRNRLGLFSLTEYTSNGDWLQAGSHYGNIQNTSYSIDTLFADQNGQRPNEDLYNLTVWTKLKHQLTPRDGLFLQTIYHEFSAGDLMQYYDPNQARPHLRQREIQDPIIMAGYHREWRSGSHTLFLASRLIDSLTVSDEQTTNWLAGISSNRTLEHHPRSFTHDLAYRSEFEIYSFELQQIWRPESRPDLSTTVLGARYQTGEFQTESRLFHPRRLGGTDYLAPTPLSQQDATSDLARLSVYGYETLKLLDDFGRAGSLFFNAGLSYDRLKYPENHRASPISEKELRTDQLSPKAGLIWIPRPDTTFRLAYTRSLGGVTFEQSFRLEPTQVAGFNQAFRSLTPESAAGSIPAPDLETIGLTLDHQLRTWNLADVPVSTYLGLTLENLRSDGKQVAGAFEGEPFKEIQISRIGKRMQYDERNLFFDLHHLIGNSWAAGLRFRMSDSHLDVREHWFQTSASESQAVLDELLLRLLYHHPSGFFSEFQSIWRSQTNKKALAHFPGDDFWQHNIFAGYRFPARRAEARLGILNLTSQDYRLHPLNLYSELPRDRRFYASLKLNF